MKYLLAIDSQPIATEGLKRIFECRGFKVIEATTTGQVSWLIEHISKFDVIVSEVILHSSDNILNLLSHAQSEGMDYPTVIYTSHNEPYILRQLSGFTFNSAVMKHESLQELHNSVECAIRGEKYISPGFRSMINSFEHTNRLLSCKSIEILTRISDGDSNRIIANAMNIGEKTVEYHRSLILKRLSCRTMTEAVCRAIKEGIIS